jgi:glucosamine--fructose-6-phosphate aminotransferase (isomerizing)
MCGIVGAIASRNVVPILTEGLKRLEYRGYDSAGIAVVDGSIRRVRRVGRVAEMENAARAENLKGIMGIAHTRWATHGGVTEPNAHPHVSRNEIAVVHNGIIENHEEQRARLKALGYAFESQTDTEVVAHLIHHYYSQSRDLFAATRKAAADLHGAYAIGVVALAEPDLMAGARMGCPMVVGLGDGRISSPRTSPPSSRRPSASCTWRTATSWRCGAAAWRSSIATAGRSSARSNLRAHGRRRGPGPVSPLHAEGDPRAAARGLRHDRGRDRRRRRHRRALRHRRRQGVRRDRLGPHPRLGHQLLRRLVARQWLESLARVPCRVELGHEYRYRDSIPNPRQLVVTISQSGETLDTMEALKRAKELAHPHTLSICNVRESAIPRASKFVFYTRAGAEIGVASTKAFTTQLVSLFTLTLAIAKARGRLTATVEADAIEQLRFVPGSIQHALNLEPQVQAWAERFAERDHALFLGRGIHYPVALEGALKLKEISYIHAEAYPAGELKHGRSRWSTRMPWW